jgi:uncharacterized FlaG/YvyC family protein
MDTYQSLGAAPAPASDTQAGLNEAVIAVNSAQLFGTDRELTLAFDRHSENTVVRLVDKKSRAVIRQVPSASVFSWARDLRTR